MKTVISIIIPTFNRAKLLQQTLDAVIAQSYYHWECIIIDDGCTDNTQEILQIYSQRDNRIKWYVRPSHLKSGGSAARNYGYQQSSGTWIQWFDDDDVMLENYLKERILVAKDHYNLIICNSYITDSNLIELSRTHIEVEESILLQYAEAKLNVVTHNCLWRKSYLENFELFNEQIQLGQEAELFQRLFSNLQKENFLIINEALVFYRQHVDSKTGDRIRYNLKRSAAMLYLFRKGIILAKCMHDTRVLHAYYSRSISLWFNAFQNMDLKLCHSIESMLSVELRQENRLNHIYIKCNFIIMRLLKRATLKQLKFLKGLRFRT